MKKKQTYQWELHEAERFLQYLYYESDPKIISLVLTYFPYWFMNRFQRFANKPRLIDIVIRLNGLDGYPRETRKNLAIYYDVSPGRIGQLEYLAYRQMRYFYKHLVRYEEKYKLLG